MGCMWAAAACGGSDALLGARQREPGARVCRLQAASYGLPAASCQLQVVRAASCKLQATSCRLQAANRRLRTLAKMAFDAAAGALCIPSLRHTLRSVGGGA